MLLFTLHTLCANLAPLPLLSPIGMQRMRRPRTTYYTIIGLAGGVFQGVHHEILVKVAQNGVL